MLTRVGLGLVLLAALARLPFVTMPFCGEEGLIANAAIKVAEGHRPTLVLGRDVDGKEYTTPPRHNIGGYVIPGLLFAPAYYLLGAHHGEIAHRIRAGIALRIVYLLLYLVALGCALAFVPRERRPLAGFVMLAFALFPLPLLGAVQAQYDGSFSTLMLLVSTLLLLREKPGWWALAGAAISIGKLEFLLVGLGSAAVVAAVVGRARGFGLYLAGAAAGSAVCFLADRANFLGGFEVLHTFSGIQTASGRPLFARVTVYVQTFWPLLWPLFAGWALAAVFAWRAWPRRRTVVAPLTAGLFAFLGYILSAWHGDGFPRYFAPVFVLLPIVLVQLELPRPLIWGAAAVLLAFGIRSYAGELRHGELALCHRLGISTDGRAAIRALERRGGQCITSAGSEAGFYSGHLPFASSSLPAEAAPRFCR